MCRVCGNECEAGTNRRTASAEETQALAARLERELPDGAVLCLHGELGAGKTCFVQGWPGRWAFGVRWGIRPLR